MKDYMFELLEKKKDAAILDIGCGGGHFLKSMRSKGFKNLTGVDIDENMILSCKAAGLGDVVSKIDDLAKYLEPMNERFDVINLREVLYYFPDDLIPKYMSAIRKALKKDGLFVVEVFNGALLTGAFFKYKDYKIRHIFTEHSLKTILEDNGFMVDKVFGVTLKRTNAKRVLWICLNSLWVLVLKFIYFAELGAGGERPTVWSKIIAAVARKR